MNTDRIREEVVEIISRTAKIDPSMLNDGATLEQAGIESIDVIDVLFHCEDVFSIDLDGSDLAAEQEVNYTKGGFTVDDLVLAIQKRMQT